ncbi:MAG: hypothetical protein IPM53_17450 [Anaerolineaceae bacterium]|nr:hypothetical protein [Anaerolineaceae bacterium]
MLLNWTYNPYTIPLFIAAAISGLLFFPARRRRDSPGAKAFAWFSALAALWCLGYALEIGATTLPAKLIWVKLQYVGIVNVSSVFIVFCLQYTRRWRFANNALAVFFIVPWLLLFAVWLEPGLGIFYREVGLDTTGPFINLDVTYGPLFWLLIVYSYTMLLAGSYLLLTLGHKLRNPYRLQTYGLVLATIFPWLGNGLYVTRLTPFPALDLTPLGFAATAVFLAWNLRKLSLLDVAPFAREIVLEKMANAMLVWNQQHRLLDFNPSAERLFNSVTPLKVSMTAPDLFQGPFAAVLPLYQQNQVQQEIELTLGNNSSYFEVTVSPLHDQRGQPSGRLLILHDVTEARLAAQEMENQKQLLESLVTELSIARDQAEAASRSKSAFLANMSHELRTPLTAIIGYNELLQEILGAQDGSANLLSYLQKAETAAYHLLAIISEILDMSKIEAGKVVLHIEEVNIEALLQNVTTVVQPLMSPNSNQFTVNCPPAIGSMYTDPTLLNQMLLNLLGNAAKFTENGTVELHVSRDDRYVQFKVCDTGIGLTPEQINGLFQPFTQADTSLSRRFSGTGLGLSISQHYCQMLGGEICVESQFGQGSTFTVNLPWHIRNSAK